MFVAAISGASRPDLGMVQRAALFPMLGPRPGPGHTLGTRLSQSLGHDYNKNLVHLSQCARFVDCRVVMTLLL